MFFSSYARKFHNNKNVGPNCIRSHRVFSRQENVGEMRQTQTVENEIFMALLSGFCLKNANKGLIMLSSGVLHKNFKSVSQTSPDLRRPAGE
jgi:hypothetical protein